MEQYYLGFDAGTQSVKTAVYDIDMNLIVQDTNATILNYPHPGWVEMDADQYLHATVTGIRNCVTKMKEKNLDPDNIRSIFGDGIICGIVGVDKDCHAENSCTMPHISWPILQDCLQKMHLLTGEQCLDGD